jgi:hypothetical protein
MFSCIPYALSQTLIKFGMGPLSLICISLFPFLSKFNDLQIMSLLLLCIRFQTTGLPIMFLYISLSVMSISYPVSWKQANEVLSLETIEQLVADINRAQTSWRAEVHRPFVGKTREEMLRISGGKRYLKALVLNEDVTICFNTQKLYISPTQCIYVSYDCQCCILASCCTITKLK